MSRLKNKINTIFRWFVENKNSNDGRTVNIYTNLAPVYINISSQRGSGFDRVTTIFRRPYFSKAGAWGII